MKKIFAMLVMMFVATVTASAQVVVHSDAIETVLSNGIRYRSMDLPGSYRVGVDFSSQFNINMQSVAQRYGQTAYQEALWKAQNARTEVVDLSRYVRNNTGVGMTGMYGMTGMGMGMYGYGMYGTNTGAGMVGGAGGMAGATSSVHIDNSNMLSTVGSGINMQYNTGTNSISISGDPLMAIGRVVAGIGGGKKKNQQTTSNGGVQVIYVDAATGRQYQQPVQQVQYQQVQPQVQKQQVQPQVQKQQQTTTTNVGSATSSNYDVSSGF